ncbi:hypothetical protein EVAR_42086_1 [Eumeta japonica]|uniref:Uncharacterized protein n=1 Tax=Eumeta variegata TaxID=151549 RepID=A0A4C1XH69_EUMVA|nr:hypothetical protein EVAR_42086_1 [Eumeta japonica]
MPTNGSRYGPLPLEPSGSCPDEKTPGHEATISPPSRTCTLKIEVWKIHERASLCVKNVKCIATPPRLKYMQLVCAVGYNDIILPY